MEFPTEPVLDQIYSAPNGSAYKWDGEKWTEHLEVTSKDSIDPIHTLWTNQIGNIFVGMSYDDNLGFTTVYDVGVVRPGSSLRMSPLTASVNYHNVSLIDPGYVGSWKSTKKYYVTSDMSSDVEGKLDAYHGKNIWVRIA